MHNKHHLMRNEEALPDQDRGHDHLEDSDPAPGNVLNLRNGAAQLGMEAMYVGEQ